MSTAIPTRHSTDELTTLRECLDGAASFLGALGEFCGAPVVIDPPRRTNHATLSDLQKIRMREAADIPTERDHTVIMGFLRSLHCRRTIARVGSTVVAELESVVIPRRVPQGARETLFATSVPLGEALRNYGVVRRTHHVGVRWWAGNGSDIPPSFDTEIVHVSAQLELTLPVAWVTETVYASALHLRRKAAGPEPTQSDSTAIGGRAR